MFMVPFVLFLIARDSVSSANHFSRVAQCARASATLSASACFLFGYWVTVTMSLRAPRFHFFSFLASAGFYTISRAAFGTGVCWFIYNTPAIFWQSADGSEHGACQDHGRFIPILFLDVRNLVCQCAFYPTKTVQNIDFFLIICIKQTNIYQWRQLLCETEQLFFIFTLNILDKLQQLKCAHKY